ncbi:predicted protein [Brucella abortus bv. 3 str. Tulya]|nr:predicted protein [Brucella abortus bv. 3 str. Tulya]
MPPRRDWRSLIACARSGFLHFASPEGPAPPRFATTLNCAINFKHRIRFYFGKNAEKSPRFYHYPVLRTCQAV